MVVSIVSRWECTCFVVDILVCFLFSVLKLYRLRHSFAILLIGTSYVLAH
jgi:hypothetical protein